MTLEVFLITGMAGSGKSVALHAFEDAGFYCVDNLPPELLSPLIALEHHRHGNRIAIAMDVRSSKSLNLIPLELQRLRDQGVDVKTIFLDANIDTLIRRFSETRRRHPLSSEDLQEGRQALVQIIELERELLAQLREHSHVIDTSTLRSSQLQSYVKSLMVTAHGAMTLVFQSFAFKRSLPIDADFVFDVRMLPNPHYEPSLKELTGLDKPVANFLERQQEVELMERHIESFLIHWLDVLERNHRSYVTVAIGCTGGQHRSVYLVERMAQLFSHRWTTLKRHRELDNIHTKPL